MMNKHGRYYFIVFILIILQCHYVIIPTYSNNELSTQLPIQEINKRVDCDEFENRINNLISTTKLNEAKEEIVQFEILSRRSHHYCGNGYYLRLKLGDAYFTNGETLAALTMYEFATPGGMCGNGIAEQMIKKNDKIARVYDSWFART
jgi:hypothetical protein